MESVNKYKIAYKALSEGEHLYNFAVDSNLFARFDSTEIIGGQCRVDVKLLRHESMLELNVDIQGEVIVACDRCLDDCPVEVDYIGDLIVKFSDETSDYDGDVMWLPTGESEVDLSQYIYESILLSLPYQRVHAEGECNPEMTARFRAITGEEEAQLEDRDEEAEKSHGLRNNDLAKLQALKEKMEQSGE